MSLSKLLLQPRTALAAGLALSATYVALRFLSTTVYRKRLLKAIALRREKRQKQLDEYREKLDSYDEKTKAVWIRIERLDLTKLIDELATESLSPLKALRAYQSAALRAHDHTNCVCLFIDEAEQQAKELEQQFKGKPKPPLYGVPIALKENVKVKGHDCTRGYAQELLDTKNIEEEDGEYVKLLKSYGAVPFVRNNVPQTMLSYHCSNPVYGTTTHPLSPGRTPGGSSGGCAALVASGGALLSIGSDMGGSIRVPAHFSGCVGLRPTSNRSTLLGGKGATGHIPMIASVRAPLARNMDALVRFYQVYYGQALHNLDRSLAPMSFSIEDYGSDKPLKIGYFEYDPFFRPTAPNIRAVQKAAELMRQKGHEVIKIDPISIQESHPLFIAAAMIDQGMGIQEALKKDILDENNGPLIELSQAFAPWKIKMYRFLKSTVGLPKEGEIGIKSAASMQELASIYTQIADFRRKIIDKWRDDGLDAVLCPAFGTESLPHSIPPKLVFAPAYSAVFNLLDFPAGVLPVTRVSSDDVIEHERSYDRSTIEGKMLFDACRGTEGLPVGVQVVSFPFRDEICLRVMKEVEDLAGFK